MPFSVEPPIVQQQRFAYISARWTQLNGLVKESSEKAVSFLTATNAGGAVAVLSFMGASEKVRAMLGPRIALCCFALGVIVTGIVLARQLHRMERLYNGYKRDSEKYLVDDMEWDTLSARDEDRSAAKVLDYLAGYAAFLLFIAGVIAGAVSLFTVRV